MLSIIKFINGIMSVAEMVMGMIRNEELRQEGRNQVAAKNANRMIKARDKAYAKVKTFDDAIAIARGKLHQQSGDNR